MYSVKRGFINSKGKEFKNIKNIHFDNTSDLYNNIGSFVLSSKESSSDSIDNGVHIFLDKNNPKLARRVYADYMNYKYTAYNDDELVDLLEKRQKNILLTSFPTGIVTIENKVIGQEIPYYGNSETLLSHFERNKLTKIPTEIYLEVLKILRELLDNGILYKDVHSSNFLIDKDTNVINLIDFDKFLMKFDEDIKYNYSTMIENIKFYLISRLNKIIGLDFENYKKATNLEELEESIKEEDYKLKKLRGL